MYTSSAIKCYEVSQEDVARLTGVERSARCDCEAKNCDKHWSGVERHPHPNDTTTWQRPNHRVEQSKKGFGAAIQRFVFQNVSNPH